MRTTLIHFFAFVLVWSIPPTVGPRVAVAQVPTTLNDFILPGSQPGDSGNLELPGKCDNCHGDYDQAVEPAFNWRGSMMAQAQRDPLYYATMTIANQDAPDSGDLCLRCHTPAGWLEGRSVPTDGSALTANDREGVQCDFCHKLVNPLADSGNPYPNDPIYTQDSWPKDQAYLSQLPLVPEHSANGMYVVDSSSAKRGPFSDAQARHQAVYSPFHSESDTCGTCHDVSNPVFEWDAAAGEYLPNSWDAPPTTFNPAELFPVERTFSEWRASEYAALNITCQDCHMRDVTGAGCNKKGSPIRSDLPLHDFTGGNTFIPELVKQLFPDEVDAAALDAGILRARAMLQSAATMTVTAARNPDGTFKAQVRVTNETGHKLPSGYPEGRRTWINLKAYDDADQMVYESGAYDAATGELTHDPAVKIYEVKPGISETLAPVLGLPAGPSFHFVLNHKIFSDNRIPPRGFTNAAFEAAQSPPVAYSYEDGQHWDDTEYDNLPVQTVRISATLYYQTTSKEYVEFLRDENHTDNWGQVFYDLWDANGKSAPELMVEETWVLDDSGDLEPPTAPADLAAATPSDSEIELTWTASTDNVGVTGYTVYRDDTAIGQTTDTQYLDTDIQPSTVYSYYVTAFDAAGNVSAPSNTASATSASILVGQYVFYNNSYWDDPSRGFSDDDAIAPDKMALLPGEAATFANYTSYSRGINGIIVDLTSPAGPMTDADFEFRSGNDNNPAGWGLISAVPIVVVRPGEGAGGSDRVTLTFADNVIQNGWLQVTVLANAQTGLAEPQVFYFGNRVGECTGDGRVNSSDVMATRNNPRPFFDPPLIDTVHDFNRDHRVDAVDTLISRNNQTSPATELQLLDLTSGKAPPHNNGNK